MAPRNPQSCSMAMLARLPGLTAPWMFTDDNLLSSAAEGALSSMGWLSGRLGQEQTLCWHRAGAAHSHTCGCQLSQPPQHALWQARPLGTGRECRSCSICQWKQTRKEKSPIKCPWLKHPLHLPTWIATKQDTGMCYQRGFTKGQIGKRCGSIPLQP